MYIIQVKEKYVEELFNKIDKDYDENANNDSHNLLGDVLDNIRFGNLLRLKENADIINSYFESSPDVFDIIKDYPIPKMMKFLQRIIKQKRKCHTL